MILGKIDRRYCSFFLVPKSQQRVMFRATLTTRPLVSTKHKRVRPHKQDRPLILGCRCKKNKKNDKRVWFAVFLPRPLSLLWIAWIGHHLSRRSSRMIVTPTDRLFQRRGRSRFEERVCSPIEKYQIYVGQGRDGPTQGRRTVTRADQFYQSNVGEPGARSKSGCDM